MDMSSNTPKLDAYRAAVERVTETRFRPPRYVPDEVFASVRVPTWPEQDEAEEALDAARGELASSDEPRTWRVRGTTATVTARDEDEALDLAEALTGSDVAEVECVETGERAGSEADGDRWFDLGE